MAAAALSALPMPAADGWVSLIDPKLSQWESIGDGRWSVMREGVLLGQRDRRKSEHQAWLYTKEEYGDFDLEVEWFLPWDGNSGISIRDSSRARWAGPPDWNPEKTPSHIGYEIQLAGSDGGKFPSGSIYLFQPARTGVQTTNDWNRLQIESRTDMIRVRLNGVVVAEHPGEPGRPLRGPVGLQLHDPYSLVLFRNLRIRALGK